MRKRRIIAWCAAVALAGLAVWGVPRLWALGTVGAGFAAQQTCACLFVSHRPLESCRRDLGALAASIVSLSPGDRQVTARAMGVTGATSVFQEGFGCALVKDPPGR